MLGAARFMAAALRDFCPAPWRSILEFNDLKRFEDFWHLKLDWLEAPNHHHGGWSGVARYELKVPGSGTKGVYLKKQENYVTRTALHPIRGVPTAAQEMRRILEFQRNRIPTLEPVYFGQRLSSRGYRAVLLTEELAGFESLEDLETIWNRSTWPRYATKRAIIGAIADLIRALHGHGYQHSSLYPKHIFLKTDDTCVAARLIDLERVKWRPLKSLALMRDLDSLNRHAAGWSKADRMRFLLHYIGEPRLSSSARRIWRRLAWRQARKGLRGHAKRTLQQN